MASCVVTTATDHQTERTLSPGTCAPAKCNNQPGIQYYGVSPTASSALSPPRTLLFVLCSDHLNTNDVVKFLFATNIINRPCFSHGLSTLVPTGNSIACHAQDYLLSNLVIMGHEEKKKKHRRQMISFNCCIVRNVTLSFRLGRYSLRYNCKRPSTIDLKRVKYLHVTENLNLFQVYFKETAPTQVV